MIYYILFIVYLILSLATSFVFYHGSSVALDDDTNTETIIKHLIRKAGFTNIFLSVFCGLPLLLLFGCSFFGFVYLQKLMIWLNPEQSPVKLQGSIFAEDTEDKDLDDK